MFVSFFAFPQAVLGKFPIQKGEKKEKKKSNVPNFNQMEEVK